MRWQKEDEVTGVIGGAKKLSMSKEARKARGEWTSAKPAKKSKTDKKRERQGKKPKTS